ncbi:MAG: 50S ribosomal protein L9 [Patescibacteria group bacterium]
MKVILLKDVPKIGRKYDVKNVADGYAVNLLLPRGLAKVATAEAVKQLEVLKAQDLTEKKIQEELLIKSMALVKDVKVVVTEKANDKGHLFAGITKERLAAEVEKVSRIKLDPESIKIAKPIKEVGEHVIAVEIQGKKSEFALEIKSN